MRVKVRLFAALASRVPGAGAGDPIDVDLNEGSTLGDMITQIMPEAEFRLTFVNGRAETLDFTLHENDEVGIFPPVGGG